VLKVFLRFTDSRFMPVFSFSLYSWKTVKCHHHNALTLSKKSKLFPCGKVTNIYVSQKDIAQGFEIPPSMLDVLKNAVKLKQA
jgi:hypothetical protein